MIKQKKGRSKLPCTEKDVIDAYKNGETSTSLSKRLGYTKQGILHILKRNGVTTKDGGAHKRGIERKLSRFEESIRKKLDRIGSSPGLYLAATTDSEGNLVAADATIIGVYSRQKKNARSCADRARKDFIWQLSFEEWYDIWSRSGKLKQRGRGKLMYALMRKDINGVFSVENVVISRVTPKRYINHYQDQEKDCG